MHGMLLIFRSCDVHTEVSSLSLALLRAWDRWRKFVTSKWKRNANVEHFGIFSQHFR